MNEYSYSTTNIGSLIISTTQNVSLKSKLCPRRSYICTYMMFCGHSVALCRGYSQPHKNRFCAEQTQYYCVKDSTNQDACTCGVKISRRISRVSYDGVAVQLVTRPCSGTHIITCRHIPPEPRSSGITPPAHQVQGLFP